MDKLIVKKTWDKLSFEDKAAAKKKHGTVAEWFKNEGKALVDVNIQNEVKNVREADPDQVGRVYGPDARNKIAFSNLSKEDQESALARWGDSYAWYLCEFTNIIAAGLREGYQPSILAKQYGLRIDEVQKCDPLPA